MQCLVSPVLQAATDKVAVLLVRGQSHRMQNMTPLVFVCRVYWPAWPLCMHRSYVPTFRPIVACLSDIAQHLTVTYATSALTHVSTQAWVWHFSAVSYMHSKYNWTWDGDTQLPDVTVAGPKTAETIFLSDQWHRVACGSWSTFVISNYITA